MPISEERKAEVTSFYMATPWGRQKLARVMLGEKGVSLTWLERKMTKPYVWQHRVRENIRARLAQSMFHWIVTQEPKR